MAMNGYTKLFNSIVASTIWSEPDETRIIWITMLAMANQRGIVETSIPGLAVLARVHVDKCREAITTLESPDPDSRSQEYEGRRIEKIDGGWLILNHAKYRAKLSADERREYKTIKQREYRERQRTSVDNSGLSGTQWTHTEAEAHTDSKEKKNHSPANCTGGELDEFSIFWDAYPKKLGRMDAKEEWFRFGCQGRLGEVLASLKDWQKTEQWKNIKFIPYAENWIRSGLWLENPHQVQLRKPDLLEQLRELEAKSESRRKAEPNQNQTANADGRIR